MLLAPLQQLLLPSLMLMVSISLLSSLHAGAGFITFASISAVVGAPTVLVVLLFL
jgi:hypothetical protein